MPEHDTNWSGRRVLVTGASGFVGSWLVKALVERQAAVVVLLRDADPQSELLRAAAPSHKRCQRRTGKL